MVIADFTLVGHSVLSVFTCGFHAIAGWPAARRVARAKKQVLLELLLAPEHRLRNIGITRRAVETGDRNPEQGKYASMAGGRQSAEKVKMPKEILFVQGAGAGTHDEWDDKLVGSLGAELGRQYAIRYPLMPNEAEPSYASWKAALLKQFDELDENAILVGHSIGGTFLIHAVAEQRPKRKWGGIFLIAPPFLGEGGWPGDDTGPAEELTRELRADVPVFLYHGTADGEVPLEHMKLYAGAIPHVATRALADRDHQLNNDLSELARDIRETMMVAK